MLIMVAAFSECNALNASMSFWRHYVKLETENKRLNQTWSESQDLSDWQPTHTQTKVQCLEVQLLRTASIQPQTGINACTQFVGDVKPLMALLIKPWSFKPETDDGVRPTMMFCVPTSPNATAVKPWKRLTEVRWIARPDLDLRLSDRSMWDFCLIYFSFLFFCNRWFQIWCNVTQLGKKSGGIKW